MHQNDVHVRYPSELTRTIEKDRETISVPMKGAVFSRFVHLNVRDSCSSLGYICMLALSFWIFLVSSDRSLTCTSLMAPALTLLTRY